MTNFEKAFALVVGEEGEYSGDPRDPGNWTGGARGRGVLSGTKFGIASHSYPNEDIKNLSLYRAQEIYKADYWDALSADALPWSWALLSFDTGVNMGVGTSARLMQDALGVLTDGKVGPRTIAAAQCATDRMLARFMAARAIRYTRLSGFETFGLGWLTRSFLMAQKAATKE